MSVSKPTQRAALGRGLSALISAAPVAIAPQSSGNPQSYGANTPSRVGPVAIPSSNLAQKEEVQNFDASTPQVTYIEVDSISPNPKQPRQDFSELEISELASSLKTVGVLQPILVRPVSESSQSHIRFQIVAGERRWRAAQRAGILHIPAIIREISDRDTLELALIENVQRENLNAVEHALAYQRLMQEFSLNQNEIAERVGKDRASVANFLRLLKLPEEVQQMVRRGELSMGHAKAILSVKEPSAQLSLAKKVIKDSLSVRDLEALVSRVVVLDTGRRQRSSKGSADQKSAFPELVDRLRTALGTKVSIRHAKSGGGKIEIEYFSEEELDRLIDQLCSH